LYTRKKVAAAEVVRTAAINKITGALLIRIPLIDSSRRAQYVTALVGLIPDVTCDPPVCWVNQPRKT